MLGVIARPDDRDVVTEFFELFKTPWEWYEPGKHYAASLFADGQSAPTAGEAVALVYSNTQIRADADSGVAARDLAGPVDVCWDDWAFRLECGAAIFEGAGASRVLSSPAGTVEYTVTSPGGQLRRIGYDLFAEVRRLLLHGQPVDQAKTPSLELHIALLRHLLVQSGVSFVEVPPRPFNRDFACCLTHDVDFFGIRRQGFDRTLVGFIARAGVSTLVDVVRGRRSVSDLVRNWRALCALPFVFLGIVPDFWQPFDDYSRIEQGLPSTYFLIPFKGRPGLGPDGVVDSSRATAYQVSDIEPEIRRVVSGDRECALHGIDAWRDAAAGRSEKAELSRATGRPATGVRMHWLYFDSDSPRALEDAGFEYDSTCGYNEVVGFRAGTSQVFQWPGTDRLMELPLTIMDSAVLSPGRMALTQRSAAAACLEIVERTRRFGGTVVVNWHCRSLAPERLWGPAYTQLLTELRRDGNAWFATAADTVSWFRWRRSIRFVMDQARPDVVSAEVPVSGQQFEAVLRVHRPRRQARTTEDVLVRGGARYPVSLDASPASQSVGEFSC